MGISIRIPKILQEKTNGVRLIEVQGATVDECFADLIRQYPDLEGTIFGSDGQVMLTWLVYINDTLAARPTDVSVQLRDGDTIRLLPLIAGG